MEATGKRRSKGRKTGGEAKKEREEETEIFKRGDRDVAQKETDRNVSGVKDLAFNTVGSVTSNADGEAAVVSSCRCTVNSAVAPRQRRDARRFHPTAETTECPLCRHRAARCSSP